MEIKYDYFNIYPNQNVVLNLVEELESTLAYVGPHLHALIYSKSRNYKDVGVTCHECIMDKILKMCPNLRELQVSGVKFTYCNREISQHKMLKNILFGKNYEFDDGFFDSLSLHLPNLNCMKLMMARNADYMDSNDIYMPYTRFIKLEMRLVGGIASRSKEEIIIRVTTKDNVTLVSRFYHGVSQDNNSKNVTNKIKLVDEYEDETLDESTYNVEPLRIPRCFTYNLLFHRTLYLGYRIRQV